VVPEEPNLEAILQMHEEESQIAISPTLEQEAPQLPDPNPAMHVRLPEGYGKLKQGIPTLVSNGLGKPRQPGKDRRSNHEWLLHVYGASPRG
jgi:hypothetical protein